MLGSLAILPRPNGPLQQVGYAKTAGQKPLDAPPLRGGQWIESSQYDCTSAFDVRSGSQNYVLTAGHCAGAGTTWWQQGTFLEGSYPIGNTSASQFGPNNNDAAVIPFPNASDAVSQVFIAYQCTGGTIFGIGCTPSSLYQNIDNQESSEQVGESTCLSGTTSGGSSGGDHCTTVAATGNCVLYSGNITVCNQTFAGYGAMPGDSGGSWYNINNKLAQGIESGTLTGGSFVGDSNYTQVTAGLNALGSYSVITCSPC